MPPCGVPRSVADQLPASKEPAFSQAWINARPGMFPKLCIRNVWLIWSNAPWISASKTQGRLQLARTRPGILKGIMRASSRTEAITVGLKPRFPAWFKRIFDHRLSHSVDQTGNAQRTGFAIPFRNVNASCGLDSAQGVAAHLLDQLVAFCCRAGELAVHPRRSFAWVVLRHSPYSGIQIRSTSQHQLHQAAYPIRLLQLARTINTTSQVPHSVRCDFPVDTVPHAWECACSDARGGSIFHKHWVP